MAKILLIEDDPFLSSLLKNRFEKQGFIITQAKNGDDAIKLLKSGDIPDLILLDLILPGKSGFEVLKIIKTDPQVARLPVLVISNLGQESDVQKGKELGAVDYVVKSRVPIDFLVDRAKEILKKSGE
ncbi:MAG: response regulator with CheY-like receiver domain and winged-helix DNA-binding domain [Parcubacteria group bacterium Athens1014_26]|nr:MAG: response regulator with CheY-like receiver domain and winged-helix DNA-binding domain [Parcubacteria group bacterium Athens1014_26]